MTNRWRFPCFLVLLLLLAGGCSKKETANLFESAWPEVDRTWVGPEFWANRLQDWKIAEGKLQCVEGSSSMPMRTVHLLTRRVSKPKGSFEMTVTTGPSNAMVPGARSGFLIGAGPNLDTRAAALVHHSYGPGGGFFAGIDHEGKLFARDFSIENETLTSLPFGIGSFESVQLVLTVSAVATGYSLALAAYDPETGKRKDRLIIQSVEPSRLMGNVALVSHPGGTPSDDATGTRFWYRDWSVAGEKLEVQEEQTAGPILSAQYTLSRNILKMTAQMMPLGSRDSKSVRLEVREGGGWKEVDTQEIVVPGYTATFRVEEWDSSRDTDYRVRYDLKQQEGSTKTYDWTGTVRHDPVEKESLVLAAFTGNHNLGDDPGADKGEFDWSGLVWFPHADLTERIAQHDPDVLFFSGDQVYEGGSPTRAQRSPASKAELDYLYKWYLWCWAFRDLARDRPTITIPDDHDVYQGNIWGAGGRRTDVDNKGGFVMPPEWVNMVERTQTANLPDPFDPTPVEQGISVYYTDMHYGRVSFAVIEDRKFKSGPDGVVPPTTSGRPDHVIDADFDPTTADVSEATLLGDRQLEFLEAWAADWHDTDMKAVLSQTPFANATSLHGPELMRLVADYDSNGWPQTKRNRAVAAMRKAHAPHIAGDQHLAMILRYGVEEWNDAGLAFGVPSIANYYPRAWAPLEPGQNREAGAPEYTGEYLDGLGNRITVYAAANPDGPSGHDPAALHDKMPGYGIVRFNKRDRTVTFECWPRHADPASDEQYPGWPRTFDVEENYSREPVAYLTTIVMRGIENPVVKVYRGSRRNRRLVYALRIAGSTFRPWVYEYGSHTVIVGEPGTDKMQTLLGMAPLPRGVERTRMVNFSN